MAKDEPPEDFLDNLDQDQLDALDQHWDDDDLLLEASMMDNGRNAHQQQLPTHCPSTSLSNNQNNRKNNNTWLSQQTGRSAGSSKQSNKVTTQIKPIVIKPDPEAMGQFTSGDHSIQQHQTSVTSVPEMDWDNDDDFAQVNVSLSKCSQLDQKSNVLPLVKPENDLSSHSLVSQVNKSSTVVHDEQFKPKLEAFPDDGFEMVFEPAKEIHCSGPVTLICSPYTYLLLVKRHLPCQSYLVVTIKAYVSTLSSRLEHNNGRCWSLSVKINDGTASMTADLGDNFLASLIGFTAPECHALREQAKYNKPIKLRIAQGMKKCQQSLVEMSGLFQLELSPHKQHPTVVKCVRFTQQDALALQQRVYMKDSQINN
jgi:hypothetical protein